MPSRAYKEAQLPSALPRKNTATRMTDNLHCCVNYFVLLQNCALLVNSKGREQLLICYLNNEAHISQGLTSLAYVTEYRINL